MASALMTCPATPDEPPVKALDDDGDLLLRVGTTMCTSLQVCSDGTHDHDVAHTFRVCSRTMARASLVWKKMLFSGFAESKPKDGDWIVSLPEDSPEAMSTLLGIIHAKFDGVPMLNHIITTQHLFEVTVLTDKYDLTHILRPWSRYWLDCVWDDASYNFLSNLELLWITWELGDQARFASTASFLAQHIKMEATVKNSLTPPEVPEIILKLHYDTVESLLRPFERLLRLLPDEPSGIALYGETVYNCRARHPLPVHQNDSGGSSKQCNLVMLEYFTHALPTVRLCYNLRGRDLGHRKCFPVRAVTAKIDSIVEEAVFTPTKLHIEHLQAQAIKSGLSRQ
ncbi:hypothetical protein PG991_013501 [Apiospora marii]|uniref:BTB domain-containing protein n=1 Tax=Apiospora marii TaxID=335849 RepID=A0ABR1R6A8_9PEZI